MTGVLGRFRVNVHENDQNLNLMPGDSLTIIKNGEFEISKEDLNKLISTNFLINGFKNNASFENSLKKIATQQK